jgi:hypothetical protein
MNAKHSSVYFIKKSVVIILKSNNMKSHYLIKSVVIFMAVAQIDIKKYLTLLFIALTSFITANAQNFTSSFDEYNYADFNDVSRDIAVFNNALGYKVAVGSYQPISANGTYNGFVQCIDAPLSPGNSPKWFVLLKGSGNDEINGVDVRVKTTSGLPDGDVYITGYFTGTAILELHSGFPIHHFITTIATLNAPSGNLNDATYFVTKLTSDGAHVWTQLAGHPTGTNTEIGNDVDVSVVGGQVQVYTTGFFRGTTNFYTGNSVSATVSSSASFNSVFTTRYVDNGLNATCLWVKTINDNANSRHDYGYGIASDASGNAFVTGSIGGNTTIGSSTLTITGSDDAFVVKYDLIGNLKWGRNFGGNGTATNPSDQGRGISVEGENIYLSGYYKGLGTFTSASPTNTDAFVAKLIDLGTTSSWVWKNKIIASGADAGYRNALSIDNNEIYVVGSVTGEAIIKDESDVTIGNIPSESAGVYANGFMVRFNTVTGANIDDEWLADNTNSSVITGVACYNSCDVYTTGAFKSYNLYDEGANVVLSNSVYPYYDFFIGKYNACSLRNNDSNTTEIIGEKQLNVTISPNPTIDGQLLFTQENDEMFAVEVLDYTGKLIIPAITLSGKHSSISLSDQSSGVYFIRIKKEDKLSVLRVVKQ